MRFKEPLHPWDVTPREAMEIQEALRPRVQITRLCAPLQAVAGVDVAFSRRSDTAWAGVVVLRYPDLKCLEERWVKGRIRFPYIPGLLSFREIPLILKALERLKLEPDLFFCDGQGVAHPRGLGLASHLGLLLGKPTIGCAKSRLVGITALLNAGRGGHSPLVYQGRVLGAAVRTRTGVQPVYVSAGHRITLEESVDLVLSCSRRYRVPEPTRQPHLLVSALRRKEEG
jgi:deoxyribonuclease V